MARTATDKYKYGGGRIEGDLAYSLDYEERRGYRQEIGRRSEQRLRKPVRRTERGSESVHRVREKQKVSPLLFTGFTALAAMVVVLVMSYAQLTELSSDVVTLKSDISALQEEHVKLLTSYEKTFDLATIKEAAEAAGMTKPSPSQIYYVDLSVPDNVVIYSQSSANVLGRALTSFGHAALSVVEYFR